MKLKIGTSLLFALPFFASAQTLSAQGFIASFLVFSNNVLIPFLLGIAFLFFIFNVIRFFVAGGSNEDGRTNAKNLAIYGVLAFVIIVVFWGIVNLLAGSLGFAGKNLPTPDYLEKRGISFPTSNSQPTPNTGSAVPTTNSGPTNLLPPSMGGPAQNAAPAPTNPTATSPTAPAAVPPSNGGPAIENVYCSGNTGFDANGNPCGIY
jgi:Type IV secretion system pilin